MDVDAAQYASIAMEMQKTDSYLEVYHRGMDYLDKPPLLFWLSSLSMKLFGVTNFAYKLPAFLMALVGLYSTYRFTKIYYTQKVAHMAAAILGSTQALFLITNDVRTDTSLLALVIFSIWQITAYIKTKSWKYLIFGFIGIGLAMLAKGPIGIVAVVIALGLDFILKKQWYNIFKWQWIVGLVITVIVLAPMTYGLYTQFDLHPEKSAYGIDSPSGVKFFYWTQSFGRITGESEWDNGAGFFFFFQSILWDLQPWVLYFILAIGAGVSALFIKPIKEKLQQVEYVSIGGFVVVFLALSLSKYKLPHYVFVTFPFAAIICARFIDNIKSKWMLLIPIIFNSLFWILVAIGITLIFPINNYFIIAILLTILCTSVWFLLKERTVSNKIFFSTLITSVGFNFMMATNFYPQLIGKYQGSVPIGKHVKHLGLQDNQFFFVGSHQHSLDFYSERITTHVDYWMVGEYPENTYFYTDENNLNLIHEKEIPIEIILKQADYPVAQLSFPFLFPETREETLEYVYLIRKTK